MKSINKKILAVVLVSSLLSGFSTSIASFASALGTSVYIEPVQTDSYPEQIFCETVNNEEIGRQYGCLDGSQLEGSNEILSETHPDLNITYTFKVNNDGTVSILDISPANGELIQILYIPGKLGGYSVKSVEKTPGFSSHFPNIVTVLFPEGLVNIGLGTFSTENPLEVTLPSTIDSIGFGAFNDSTAFVFNNGCPVEFMFTNLSNNRHVINGNGSDLTSENLFTTSPSYGCFIM